MPSFLISPTAFKGTLAPSAAARIIADTIHSVDPSIRLTLAPLADGGDGTLDVLLHAFKGKVVTTPVRGPMGNKVRAQWGFVRRQKMAVIEMARASGLALVKGRKRILDATSFGTGELIKAALNRGCRRIFIGVGGTASSDGGAGALQALGLRYYDKDGRALSSRPRDLVRLARVEWSRFDRRLPGTKIHVLCDVTNPLLGPRGSAITYGPQKGANQTEVRFLERMLTLWARHARTQTKNKPGAGAAGALAFGLSAFAGAKLARGTPFIMEKLGWRRLAGKADIIITGEGRLDRTSFQGKVIGTILRGRGKARVYAICGKTPMKRRFLRQKGINNITQMGPGGLKYPKSHLKQATKTLWKAIKHDL